jgi:hypothetical protein
LKRVAFLDTDEKADPRAYFAGDPAVRLDPRFFDPLQNDLHARLLALVDFKAWIFYYIPALEEI